MDLHGLHIITLLWLSSGMASPLDSLGKRYMCCPGWSSVNGICTKPVCKYNCWNHGQCIAPNKCLCNIGFQGPLCEQPRCRVSCANGGVCIPPFRCACPPGYTGRTCQTAICSPACLPPQRCQAPNQCTCPPGLTGPQCTIDVNECETGTARCQHGCINTPGSFRCTCQSGYRLANDGRSCIAICDKPCRNLGVCLIPNHCSCFPWFSGAACEVVRRR
ncbi:von Willebrand factor D and EGF domain-containing protein-like isoform X2 [Chiloscyllium plagiosum]|uniref:von Willebrand factor D and EGF domain-containing protein-like isoform X2 n=1 Tax=Chiloscyllium plagiosum TaxID=36176 RepID=UPI001CB7B2A5|nr:von Willebrand factor D and EGF domain-containing protein-like isoform X2 [Chiloscyllium plagiosum]